PAGPGGRDGGLKRTRKARMAKQIYNTGDEMEMLEQLDAAGVDQWANHASVMRRCAMVRRWTLAKLGGKELGYLESQITARFLLHIHATYGLDVCRASLFKWDELYREGGIAALMDGRATRGHSPRRGGAGGAIEGHS
ncbi:MAG TPA: hypothetical protein VFC78_00660, partial [Tepidisphaeraceae bacterium]|nr:hypothetical protein [Tepidisphaeraceae bacterium]